MEAERNALLKPQARERLTVDRPRVEHLDCSAVTIDLFDAESHSRLGHFAERNQITPVSSRAIRARPSDAVYEMDRISRKWARQMRQLLEVLQQDRLASWAPADE